MKLQAPSLVEAKMLPRDLRTDLRKDQHLDLRADGVKYRIKDVEKFVFYDLEVQRQFSLQGKKKEVSRNYIEFLLLHDKCLCSFL